MHKHTHTLTHSLIHKRHTPKKNKRQHMSHVSARLKCKQFSMCRFVFDLTFFDELPFAFSFSLSPGLSPSVSLSLSLLLFFLHGNSFKRKTFVHTADSKYRALFIVYEYHTMEFMRHIRHTIIRKSVQSHSLSFFLFLSLITRSIYARKEERKKIHFA